MKRSIIAVAISFAVIAGNAYSDSIKSFDNEKDWMTYIEKNTPKEYSEMKDLSPEECREKLKTREDVVPYAQKMQKEGARNVLVSMAGEGAVLVAEDGQVYMSPCPKGKVKNSVGAGDSMVAGFIAGYMETGSYKEALRKGLLTGSASAFSDNLATKDEVEELGKHFQL